MGRGLLRAATMILVIQGTAGFLQVEHLSAQDWAWPDRAQNLTELPPDFPPERLSAVMRGFSQALGVRCSHCHVGEEGQPLSTYDFVSDANPNKDTARAMYQMLGVVNDHLGRIEPSGEEVNGLGGSFLARGDTAVAFRIFEHNLDTNAQDWMALERMGDVWLARADTARALEHFERSLAQRPDNPRVAEKISRLEGP